MDDEIIIVNNVETRIECHKIIFNTGYSDLGDKVYRSFLFTKICDRWIIEGMVGIRDESFEYN